jgi:uncharacterized protein (TIRG00374 family)
MTAVDVVDVPVDRDVVAPAGGQTPPRSHSRWRLAAFVVLAAMVVVEVVLVAPYFAPAMSDVYRSDLRWLALAVVSELLSMAAFARVQRRMLAAGGTRVRMRRMVALTYVANAVSVSLPGGVALSPGYVFKRLRSWGATVPAAGFTVVASGVLSTLSFALLAVVCAVVAGSGGLSSVVVSAGVGVAAIAVLGTRRHHKPDLLLRLTSRTLVRVNRILHRTPEAGLAGLRRTVAELAAVEPRHRDWLAGFGFAELNWVADLACLVACCHAVGADESSLLLVTVAYVAGKAASSISLVPGGLGVVDAAMIFALTQGGVSTLSATAGVLLYRLISFALVVAIGWLVWGVAWMGEHRGTADFRQPCRSSP